MKFLSGLGNLAGALLMTCLGGIVALVKPPAKGPVVRTQRLPQTQPISPLAPPLSPSTAPNPLTPTEAETVAVAETVAAIAQLQHPQPAPVIEPQESPVPVIEPGEPTEVPESIAQFQPTPTPTPIDAPPPETATEIEPAAIAPPEIPTPAAAPPTAHPQTTTLKTRAEQVYAILDATWADGTTSYSKLISAVRETTGKGCSKAKIAAWKKERGLISA